MARSSSRRQLLRTAAVMGGAALVGPLAPLARAATGAARPDTVPTPAGFEPEGIAVGPGGVAYTGSLLDGSIYAVELATGRGRMINQGNGHTSAGIGLDPYGRLLVAGGYWGEMRLIDRHDGGELAYWKVPGEGTTFVNDAVEGWGRAWFTDSFNDVLYHVPLGATLPDSSTVGVLPLSGAWAPTPPGGDYWGANGIELTPDRRALLIVHDTASLLYRVDPRTGIATEVALDGGSVVNGDGMVLHGRTLYVVRNWDYAIEVFTLSADGTRGTFVRRITDPRFDEPTAAAVHADRLYVVNARFDSDWSDPTMSSFILGLPLSRP